MKKLFLPIISMALLVGCSDNDQLVDLTFQAPCTSNLRTMDEAINIAQHATSLLDDFTPSSRSIGRTIDLSSPVHIIHGIKSRANSSDTLMYVINYANNQGFAIVSALPNTTDLIAVTISGNYDPDVPTDNPGFNLYMDTAIDYLSDKSLEVDSLTLIDPNSGRKPNITEKTETDTIWIKKIPNRVTTYWGQFSPAGDKCPNKTVGCTPLAAAMAMSAFEYPSTIKLNYTDDDTNEQLNETLSLNWSKLKQHNSFSNFAQNGYGCTCSETTDYEIHDALASLCRQLGFMANTNYIEYGRSSTSPSETISVLNSLGYQTEQKECTEGSISEDLNMSNVLFMSGWLPTNTSKGHSWICDAVKVYKLKYRYYRSSNSGLSWTLYDTLYSNEQRLNFFNWGFDSPIYCGYFSDMVFKPKYKSEDYSYNTMYYIVSKAD